MKKVFLCVIMVIFSFAQSIKDSQSIADCLILEDENSVVCKYSHEILDMDEEIQIFWVNPSGKVSRKRILVIPAGNCSVYDFRYTSGRTKGVWTFKVIEANKQTSTTFELK